MIRNALQVIAVLGSVAATTVAASDINFNRDIRPLLSDRCFHCHGPSEDTREAGLRLDLPDGDEGALRDDDGTHIIKPGHPNESELWSRITTTDEDLQMPPVESNKSRLTSEELELFRRWIEEGATYDDFWSFVPLTPIHSQQQAEERHNIDTYVKRQLDDQKWKGTAEADKRTLIRRVTLDLTGLPPTLQEIDSFLKDKSDRAYAKLVDRLLANQAYGEHMARYWADLVRLADTNGMHKDFYRNFTSYRDWLIRAFNDNLRFDDFIRYQLAGDLIEDASQDQLIASGFNRLHLIIDKGTALPEESHHKNVLDRVEAFGTAFLGLTVQCAQCHDHKYDPISQKEFYQLYAFFNNFDGAPETRNAPKNGIQQPAVELTEQYARRTGVATAMVMKERDEPKKTHILVRGAYDNPGEEVQRNTPSFLPSLPPSDGVYSRLDLANWLVSPQHPLTSRVTVNRIWQQFFGVGLVKTTEDFGAQGEWPSHPELLDHLASSLIDSGWNVKQLVRDIVLSDTYRQSSDAPQEHFVRDPENRLLARGPRFRMDAEMLRDQILMLSGKLNREMYGPSVKPPQPPGLWEAVSMAAPFTYVADKGDQIYRRSLYTYWRRAMPPPQMTILNAPSREYCTARRERTNTPLQALLLMNETEYFNAAKSCAVRTRAESKGDIDAGLSLLYEKVTSHRPTPERLQLLKNILSEFRDLYSQDKQLTDSLTSDLGEVAERNRVEVAAWTMLTHSLFNLELAKVKR